jgi:ubiquinol-cytochrome c reductase cytochrome b subunit
VVTGGGNMPAYGKNLSPPEIEALVSFLETLHPSYEHPAVDSAEQELPGSNSPVAQGKAATSRSAGK